LAARNRFFSGLADFARMRPEFFEDASGPADEASMLFPAGAQFAVEGHAEKPQNCVF